jgi:hypothetical protein
MPVISSSFSYKKLPDHVKGEYVDWMRYLQLGDGEMKVEPTF